MMLDRGDWNMKRNNWAVTLGLMALATFMVTAQKPKTPPSRPDPSQAPLFRTTTNAVSVDVVVRSTSGQFLPDLKVEDFVVLEDGVPQKIQTMSMAVGGRFLNVLSPQVAFTGEGIIAPAVRPQQDTSGRLFIFFIDDANIEFTQTPQLRDLLRHIVKTLFHQGDLIAMVSSGTSSIEVNQTYDLKRINDEISKVAGGGMTPEDIIQAGQTSEGPAGLRYQANLAFRTALDMLDQLGQVSGKRKAFVWVSCGYDFNPFQQSRDKRDQEISGVNQRDPNNPNDTGTNPANYTSDPFQKQGLAFSASDLNIELLLLTQAANRANTTFYTVDPRGLTTDMAPLNSNFADVKEWRDYQRNTQDSLRTVADLTHGFAIVNTNDFDAGLKRIDNEMSDYYMLGYTSNNPDPLKKTRKIDVQVKRTGAQVTNWRQSYDLNPVSMFKNIK
jgi:VWFA-related protein